MAIYKHILICGGSGKRLWPLSRENYPKPYLLLNNQPSLFQETIRRHSTCSDHLIITNQNLFYQSNYQLNQISTKKPVNFLLESEGKNTGPAILLAALHSNPDDYLVVTPADHQVSNTQNYQNDISTALDVVEQTNGIVLIGIKPTHPSTEYGYINENNGKVKAFKEKPNAKTAAEYINEGTYLWNSGIFCFKATSVVSAFQHIQPKLFESVAKAYETKNSNQIVDFSLTSSMQFDKGILEQSDNIHVINNSFDWNDIGCFDELEKFSPQNKKEIQVNAANTFSFSTSEKTVAFHDVDDVYLIESNDAILVGKKGKSKHVSDIVKSLEKTNKTILKHSNIVYRPWGYYNVLFESETYKVKQIVVYPNQRLSLQKHKFRSEHWTCVKGKASVINGNDKQILQPNESIYIEKESVHRIENNTSESTEIIEVQCGSYLGEDDIIRIESDY
tara:strand:- start:2716 stop:4056 length:1341 start_codon:yes stop_codon:yes gene_type:complete